MPTRIIGPEGRTDRAREPIQPNIREKLVPRENSFDVSCAVRPRTKFLYDPGRKTRRGVRQRKGERLGPSTLNPAITGFLLQPGPELLKVAALLRRASGEPLRVMAHRHHVKVQSRHTLRISEAKARRDPRAPISALRTKTPVAQNVCHQLGETVGNCFDPKARL